MPTQPEFSQVDLTKRTLPPIYDVEKQKYIATQRQLLCEGQTLEKKSRSSGVFNKWQRRFVWITPQGKKALKVMYWCNVKGALGTKNVTMSHDALRKVAVEKKHFVALKDIKSIQESKGNKYQFDILTKGGLLIQFKMLPRGVTRSEWISALKSCMAGKLIYLLEFSKEDITSEVVVKDHVSGLWKTCVVVDYVVTDEQEKKNEPGYHVLAKENGLSFQYFKIDLLRTPYKMERGKNKSFAHERVSREVENYKKMKLKDRKRIRNSVVLANLDISANDVNPRPPSNSVLNLPPPPSQQETKTTVTTVEIIRELRVVVREQQALINRQRQEEEEFDKKLQKFADEIKDKDEEIRFLRNYLERARDRETVENRLKMLEQDVDDLKHQLERAYRDAEKWRKEAERLRAEMDKLVAEKHKGTNMDPPPRTRPPADENKWLEYTLLFSPPPADDAAEKRDEPPVQHKEETKTAIASDNNPSSDENKKVQQLLADLEKEKESRRNLEVALRLAQSAKNDDDEKYRLEFQNKEEELKEQVRSLKKSRSALRLQLGDALKVATMEKEAALQKFAEEHDRLEESENEKVRLQIAMVESSRKSGKLQNELNELNKKLEENAKKSESMKEAAGEMNALKLAAAEKESENLRQERSNLILRLLESQKQNAKQKDELATILRLEKNAHMHDQEEARQLKNQLEKKVSDELAAQKAAEARTEDLLHRLESEKNHRLKIQTELAAARKAQYEHTGKLQAAAEEREKELLSQQQTLKSQRSRLRIELGTRLKAVEEEKESTDEELKRVQQQHIIALRDYEAEHDKLVEYENKMETLTLKMEDSKRKESEMEKDIVALREKLEDKSKLTKEEHDMLKEKHNDAVSRLLIERESISKQKEELATLLLLEKTAHRRDVEESNAQLEILTKQLHQEEIVIKELKDALRKQEMDFETGKEEEVRSLKDEVAVQVVFCEKLQSKIKYLTEKEEKSRRAAEEEKSKSELEIQYLEDELAEIRDKLAKVNNDHAKAKSSAELSKTQADQEQAKLLKEFAVLHDKHEQLSHELVIEQNKLASIKERDAALLRRADALQEELNNKKMAEEEAAQVRKELETNLANEMVLNDKLRSELWTALHQKDESAQKSQKEIDDAKAREESLKADLDESTNLLKTIRIELENQLHDERMEREKERKLAKEKKEELLAEIKIEHDQQKDLTTHVQALQKQLEDKESAEKAIKFDHRMTKAELNRKNEAVQKLLVRIRTLKRQEQANLETRRKMRLEIIHVNKLRHELKLLNESQQNAMGEMAASKEKEIEVLKAKIAIGRNVINDLKYDLERLEQKIEEEKIQNDLLRNRITELEHQDKLATEEIERQNAALAKSEESSAKLIHMLQMNKQNYKHEIKDLKEELRRQSKKLEDYKRRNNELTGVKEKNNALQNELEESFNRSEFEISLLRTKLEMSTNLVEELRYSNDQLQDELKEEKIKVAKLQKQLEALKANSSLDSAKRDKEIAALRQQLDDANKKIEKCNDDIEVMEKEREANKKIRETLENIVTDQKQDLTKAKQDLALLQKRAAISKAVIEDLREREQKQVDRVTDSDNRLVVLEQELESARKAAQEVKITLGRQLNNEREEFEKQLKEEQRSHINDVEKSEMKKKELQRHLDDGKEIQKVLNDKIEMLQKDIVRQKESADSLEQARSEIEEKLAKEVDENSKLRDRLNELTEKSILANESSEEHQANLIREKNDLEEKLKLSNLKVEMMQNNLREQLENEKRAHKADLEEDKKRKTALRHSLEHSENVRRELSDKLHEKDAYIEKIEREADKSREEAHQMEVAQAKLIEYLQDQLKEMEEKLKHCCDCNKKVARADDDEASISFSSKDKSQVSADNNVTFTVLKKQKDDRNFTVNSKKKRVKQSGRKVNKVTFSGGQGTAKGLTYYRGQW